MNLKVVAIVLMTAIFSAASPAFAQEQGKREALAAELIELARLDQIMEQLRAGMVAGMQASMQRAIEEGRIDASGDKLQKVSTALDEELEATFAQMLPLAKDLMTSFYAERMTEAELGELVAMYQRPVIDKMYELAPELNRQMLAIAIAQQKDSEARLLKRLQELKE